MAVLPETTAEKLLLSRDEVVGVRTGDKGRGRAGEELPRFEPGSDVRAQVTILAEGTAGHLTTAALSRFELGGSSPQTWALGVKEVWKVARPMGEVIHTMGWPLRTGGKFRRFGGAFVYAMSEEMLTIGMVVGLDYRDAALSVHDLLQELKTHGFGRSSRAAKARCVGREDDPGGAGSSLPKRSGRRGC